MKPKSTMLGPLHIIFASHKFFARVFYLLLLGCMGVFTACQTNDSTPNFTQLPALPEKNSTAEPPREKTREAAYVLLALVGEVRGEIEPCGCPTLPFGGFNRRERLLNEYRNEIPTFHLDAGEMLLKGFSTNSRVDVENRSKLMLELSAKVDLDVLAASPSDLVALGLKELKKIEQFPVISSTWTDLDGRLLLPPAAVIKKNGIRIGFIGYSAPVRDPKWRDKIKSIDTVLATKLALEKLPKDLDLLVGLGSINDDAAKKIRETEPGISILLTTRGSKYEEPVDSKGSMPGIVETPERGRYVQAVYVRIGGDAGSPAKMKPSDITWRDWIKLNKLKSIGKKSGDEQSIEDKMAAVGDGRNLFYVETVPLNKSYDGKATVDKEIEAFKKKALVKADQSSKEEIKEGSAAFASAGNCARCHSKEFSKWVFSDHAKAWQSLVKENQTENPECVQCHSTGFGQPGGLGKLEKVAVRKFKAVQCESCHGPMAGHPDNKNVTPQKIGKENCIRCHDEANSPQFDFGPYLLRSTCQSGD